MVEERLPQWCLVRDSETENAETAQKRKVEGAWTKHISHKQSDEHFEGRIDAPSPRSRLSCSGTTEEQPPSRRKIRKEEMLMTVPSIGKKRCTVRKT